MKQLVCSFLGLGLIGGSIARAIRSARPDSIIKAYDINAASLEAALSDGVADIIYPVLNDTAMEEFCSSDYIFLCAPVSHNNNNLLNIKKYLKSGTIITDVGSVKTPIHKLIEDLDLQHCFIGGHPMAGSERIGYANSKVSLLENAYYILTPTKQVPLCQLEYFQNLVKDIGAIPLVIDHQKHDHVTAAISHLPHVIASSLVNLVHDSDDENGIMKMVAAGGFKDITRIASSSTVMWQQICLTNSVNISNLLGQYIDSLLKIKEEIDSSNAEQLYSFFDEARKFRDSFIDASSGPIKKVYTINVDIPDEAGSLAMVATLLAFNHISIKNIGIVHNRESEDGVLRIEFHEPEAIEKASALLTARGYNVFLKK